MGRLTDLTLDDLIVLKSVTLPSQTLGDTEHTAGDPLGVTKARQVDRAQSDFNQDPGTNVSADTRRVHIAKGSTESIIEFRAGLETAVTASGATVSFDLHVNGSSVLSSTLDFTNGDSSRDVKTATPSTQSLSADDWVEVVITTSGSPDGKGPFAEARIDTKET